MFFHDAHHVFGEIFGVVRHKAQTKFAADRSRFIEKGGEIRAVLQIVSVRIDVLPEQRDFFVALIDKRLHFRDDIIGFS